VTAGGEAQGRSSLGLRLVHAAVFLAFAAGVVVAALSEWRHGVLVLGQPFHVGEPPRAFLLLGSVLAVVGAVSVLVALARGRSAPQVSSWLILSGLVAGMYGASGPLPPVRPSEHSVNIGFIETAQRVQLLMVSQLQELGEVPVAHEPWQRALDQISPSALHWARTRQFKPVPPQVVLVDTPEALPRQLIPGSLLLHLSPDGAAFEMRLVGLSQGQPQVLKDETGVDLVLRGLYNPDLPSEPARSLP
jgi:hypothetical protein